jgi:hypothetical protein
VSEPMGDRSGSQAPWTQLRALQQRAEPGAVTTGGGGGTSAHLGQLRGRDREGHGDGYGEGPEGGRDRRVRSMGI